MLLHLTSFSPLLTVSQIVTATEGEHPVLFWDNWFKAEETRPLGSTTTSLAVWNSKPILTAMLLIVAHPQAGFVLA